MTTKVRKVLPGVRAFPHRMIVSIGVLSFAVIGAVLLVSSHAATPTASFEAEAGTRSSNTVAVSDTAASGGSAVRFSASTAFSGTKVAIIGDSLIYQDAGGQGAVSTAFEAAGWPHGAVWFYGVVGKAINDPDNNGKTTVQNIAAARSAIGEPDVWVIALGTNNALNFASSSKVATDIQAVLTALGSNAKVLWVNTAGDPGDNFSTLNGTVRDYIGRECPFPYYAGRLVGVHPAHKPAELLDRPSTHVGYWVRAPQPVRGQQIYCRRAENSH